MAPYPRESNSSSATGVMIAAVVIGVLLVGLLAMVVLGFLFVFYVPQELVKIEIERDVAPVVEQMPGEVPPTIGDPLDQQPVVLEPESPARSGTGNEDPGAFPVAVPVSPVTPSSSVTPSSPDEPDRTGASDSVTPGSAGPPRKPLVELTPLEVLNVRLGDTGLVRAAHVAGQSHASAIWAQPAENLGTCQISYPLRQAYQRLSGAAAVADAVRESAAIPSGTFRIYGDGNLLWDSGTLEGYGSSRPFDVAVVGLRQVALVVESDSPSDVSQFAWVDLQLAAEPTLVSP
jgi:hypothetical protein